MKSEIIVARSLAINGADQVNSTRSVKMQRNKPERSMLVDMPRKSDALVIGNGKSRLQFDLNQLQELFTTYGCNALYRDFMPDNLIAVDIPMIYDILKANIHHSTNFYIQGHSQFDNHVERNNYKIIHYAYKEAFDSGNSAILVACQNQHKKIYIIGMDYDVYNVYSNTQNYNSVSHDSLPSQWQKRIKYIIDKYKDVEFIRVNANNIVPNIQVDNFTNISVEQFKEITNEL